MLAIVERDTGIFVDSELRIISEEEVEAYFKTRNVLGEREESHDIW
jgi:hypothetical protein